MRAWLLLSLLVGCGSGGLEESGESPRRGGVENAPRKRADKSAAKKSPKVERPESAVSDAAERLAETLAYPLDRLSRKVPLSGTLRCPPVELVRYPGSEIRYHKSARVYAGFVPHLKRFEEIAKEVSLEVYGRVPDQLRHNGAYYCRRIGTWPYLVSEHGLGNALDVEGFSFKRLGKGQSPEVPKRWRGSFHNSLGRHWTSNNPRDAEHRRFFRLLAQRVIDEEGLFRVILGPADPNHRGHFHFDMAQHRIVNVF